MDCVGSVVLQFYARIYVKTFNTMLGVFVYALFVIFTLTLSIVLLAALKWREEDGKGRVAVIVLGDLGRSPRMQYHALSLCREGYEVEFVGYGGKKYTHLHMSRHVIYTWKYHVLLSVRVSVCFPLATLLQHRSVEDAKRPLRALVLS